MFEYEWEKPAYKQRLAASVDFCFEELDRVCMTPRVRVTETSARLQFARRNDQLSTLGELLAIETALRSHDVVASVSVMQSKNFPGRWYEIIDITAVENQCVPGIFTS